MGPGIGRVYPVPACSVDRNFEMDAVSEGTMERGGGGGGGTEERTERVERTEVAELLERAEALFGGTGGGVLDRVEIFEEALGVGDLDRIDALVPSGASETDDLEWIEFLSASSFATIST